MKTILSAAAICLAVLCGAAAAAESVPVPASQVRAWAEDDTFWCMNPTEAGGCDGIMAVWRPARTGGFEFVAAESVDGNGGLFTVTQPFTLEGDRQCYTIDPATIRFGTIGDPKGPGLADAQRRWQIGLRDEAGKRYCMAFLRDPETGLVRRRQWENGVARENPVAEVWRVKFMAPEGGKP